MSIARKSKYHCDIRASFATAFRNWRRRNDVPLKKVAADLGLSIATINKWELGERFPSGHNFEMLADYTGEPPCRLFCLMANQCIPADCLLATERKR
ncbi:MAG: helix-turn-helix domain-containing protein [Verrucomicrobia bacterium]|jgi:transcriptional regulator with XRE-family HTH domain|nr:helix-turn-helix domain-containing protein [Verrucomicrobiota bacterium]